MPRTPMPGPSDPKEWALLGAKLRIIREECNYTSRREAVQEPLWQKLTTSPKYLEGLENGRRKFTDEKIQILINDFGIPEEWLKKAVSEKDFKIEIEQNKGLFEHLNKGIMPADKEGEIRRYGIVNKIAKQVLDTKDVSENILEEIQKLLMLLEKSTQSKSGEEQIEQALNSLRGRVFYEYMTRGNANGRMLKYLKKFQVPKTHFDKISHMLLGFKFLEKKQDAWKHALRHFERAMEISPDDPVPPYFIAALFGRIRKYSDAIKYYSIAIDADMTFELAYIGRKNTYLIMAETEKAKADEEKVKELVGDIGCFYVIDQEVAIKTNYEVELYPDFYLWDEDFEDYWNPDKTLDLMTNNSDESS